MIRFFDAPRSAQGPYRMDLKARTDHQRSATTWYVRLLGRLEVVSPQNEIVRFRSRTAAALLAYLSLEKTKEHSNEKLQEVFWPESDGDRQSQNLRRAIADLRQILEEGQLLGSAVITRKNHVALNPDAIHTDVDRFRQLTEPSASLDSPTEALMLYAGPLLEPLPDSWMLAERMNLEERFAQLVARACKRFADEGAVNEAIRVGRSAVAIAPLREDIHIALITSYRRADMEAEAIRQYEELERVLREAWGEAPSESARLALMEAPPEAAVGEWDPSGGAMALDSTYYVRRGADAQTEELLGRGEGVVLLQGPRQVGKSSLLARALAFARSSNIAVVLTDAQSLGKAQLENTDQLYKMLAHGFARQLGIEIDVAASWSDWLGANVNLDTIIGRILFECPRPVCWAIDEADLLFDRPYTNDFFGLLRSWHNRRALDPDGPWRKLTLMLSYATEAHLFITDLNQSPFNVGVRMPLSDFSQEEVKTLQSRHGEMGNREAWRTVFEITHGHPYLSQCAFAFLAKGGNTDDLAAKAARQDGPFGTHLNRMLVSIAQSEEMFREVKRMLDDQAFESPTTRYRLQSAGLISITATGAPEFRAPIYEAYLRAEIG